MSRVPTLDYSASQLPSSRYEWQMESDRLRWLRRRFNWFCVVLCLLTLVTLPVGVWHFTRADGWERFADAINIAHTVLYCSLLAGAWWYARKRLRDERDITRLAMVIVVAAGLLGMVASRVTLEFQVRGIAATAAANAAASGNALVASTRPASDAFSAGLAVGRRVAGHDAPDLAPNADAGDDPPAATQPGLLAGIRDGYNDAAASDEAARRARSNAIISRITSNPATRTGISVGSMFGAVFVTHFVACLFLPWRVREAVRPAAVLLAGAAALVLVDLLLLGTSIWGVPLAASILPFAVLPGIGWCWWRYSRYRKTYRFVFEGRELRDLRKELDGAKRIHESSLPPIYPAGPLRLSYVYEPMSQIGGDLIFVHPRPPKKPVDFSRPAEMPPPPRHTMVLLDVTGHGVAAALTVNRLVGELERVFAENHDATPAEVMSAVNRYVYLTLAPHGVFVTGLAASIDPSAHADCAASLRGEHAVQFCSAGHPTAFLRRADAGTIEPLESTAMMLGVLPPEAFEADQTELCVRPGDAIVAYTDGANEARDGERRQMIGINGVRDLLAEAAGDNDDPLTWPESMIRRVGAYRNAPPEDDTLIAVIYRPPAPAEAAESVETYPRLAAEGSAA